MVNHIQCELHIYDIIDMSALSPHAQQCTFTSASTQMYCTSLWVRACKAQPYLTRMCISRDRTLKVHVSR